MSKTITIAGNTYPDVPSIIVPCGAGTATFYDCVGVLSVTENGEHDCAGYNSVYVDVEGGSTDVPFVYGGMNAEKVAEYSETFTLADTSFVIGSSASTSATSIKATVANRFTSSTITIGDKDIVVVQKVKVTPTHGSTATNKAKQLKYGVEYVTHLSKRKTSDTSNKTTRQASNMSNVICKYYNTSAVIARANTSYGFYATPQTPSTASTTAASTTVRVSSPILYYRASSSYESTTNIKLVTACTWEWNVEVYLVDAWSSIASQINDDIDEMLCD